MGGESGSPGEHQHQAVVQGEAVAQVHPPGLADSGSPQPDVVSNLANNGNATLVIAHEIVYLLDHFAFGLPHLVPHYLSSESRS